MIVPSWMDVLAPMASNIATFEALGSTDKALRRFGIRDGHLADYGHCDLVWSRHAPREIFPVIAEWLDARQPEVHATPQEIVPVAIHPVIPSPQTATASPVPLHFGPEEGVEADLRPGLE